MLEWQQQLQDPQEFLRSVKEDLFTEEVFAFTPKGDLLAFPLGSTVIDFAYRIHSEVGHHCAGARVNGKIVPLRYQLQSGDTVEIVTTANQQPSKDWLKLVKTPRAKERIRAWVKAQQSSRSAAVGRELLARDLARHQLHLAKLPGEATLRGVAVHPLACPKVLEGDPLRRIDVQWEDGKGTPGPVRVEVTCIDQPGLLAAMSKAISSAGINITRAQVHALGDRKAQNVFELMVASADELNRVMRSLGRVRGVMKVARVRT